MPQSSFHRVDPEPNGNGLNLKVGIEFKASCISLIGTKNSSMLYQKNCPTFPLTVLKEYLLQVSNWFQSKITSLL